MTQQVLYDVQFLHYSTFAHQRKVGKYNVLSTEKTSVCPLFTDESPLFLVDSSVPHLAFVLGRLSREGYISHVISLG